MAILFIIFSALLGLAFYESIRVFKGAQIGKKAIPSFGYTAKVNFTIYLIIVTVFVSVSVFLSLTVFSADSKEAFLLGFSVPSGANLATLKPRVDPEDDETDDHASIFHGKKLNLLERFIHAYKIYALK